MVSSGVLFSEIPQTPKQIISPDHHLIRVFFYVLLVKEVEFHLNPHSAISLFLILYEINSHKNHIKKTVSNR